MDYLADLTVTESCSILEQTTPTKNGGTASCRSAVFFGSEEEDGRGRERESGRRGEDFEMMEEELEDGNGTSEEWNGNRRGMERDFEEEEKGTLRRRNQDFEEGKKGNRESCDSIAVFW